ncbi:tripeptidyl-peptidase, partial [Rhizoctonia solani AG-3 Rhs1AP]
MYVLPILALAALAAGSPVSQDFTTRHVLREVPSGWTVVARAPAEHNVELRIGLKQGRMTDLLSILGEVSDPANPRYGKHLSKEDVDKLVAPRSETTESVEQWLRSHGVQISGRSSAGDWIHATVPVSRAEKMLGNKYNVYRHTSGAHIVRSESYALPRSLDSHIDADQPTTYFGRINERSTPESSSALERRASTVFVLPDSEKQALKQPAEDAKGKAIAAVPSSCSSTITPTCLKALYKTDSYTPKAGNASSIGITGYLEQYASTSDLQTFYTKFNPSAIGSTFGVELINGGKNSQTNPGIEANLDVQPYLEWVNYILNKTTLPFTISTSYGDDEQTVPLDYATRLCNSFAQLGARGVSLLFSSGDGGVGSGTCKTNDGTNRTRFQPIFPASCPYVTAVGGTYKVSPEVGLYNTTGRGFPDVAAQGNAFQIVQGGRTTSVAGTSASAPAFAGVIALLNDYRLSQGKSPLGFLNPWLYSSAVSALSDITSGNNPGCGTNGFTARAGWDPVTGLGTPDFVKLQSVA